MNDIALINESGVIGSILLDARCLPDIVDVITADDFTSATNREIYSAIVELYTSGETIDAVTVTSSVMRAKGYTDEQVGKYIIELWNLTPTTTNAGAYAKGLRDDARMRRISALLTSAMMKYGDPDELADVVMDGLYDIERGGKKGKAVQLKSVLDEFTIWAVDKSADGRIDTGYSRLDDVLRGMHPGNLILLAARPAVGKSAFAAEIALRAAAKGTVTVLFSCEMSSLEIAQRYISNRAEVSLNAVTDRSFLLDERGARVAKASDAMRGLPLYLYDEPGVTIADIRRTMQTIKNIGFVVVDYIQLMHTMERGENRNLEVAKISGELKHLARVFEIPIMALSQFNRTRDEYDEPSLTALRDSGSLEQDADKAIFIWKLEAPAAGELPKVGVKVAKNRMAPTGTVVMYYRGEHMKFLETAEDYVEKKRGRGRQFEAINSRDPDFPWKG